MIGAYPERIVCLTEEPTEVIYALGQSHRIVGISGYTVRPPRARKEKPKVAAFTSAKIDDILALKPDMAIGFSDLQADIAQALIRAGVEVWISNHRTVAGILAYIQRLGALLGCADETTRYLGEIEQRMAVVRRSASALPRRPKVYFEEWDEPRICGIGWISELIGIAGGEDVCAQRAMAPLARARILENPDAVIELAPDLILGSWCGKKFRPERVAARPGWDGIPAVMAGQLHEIKAPLILQPGPAALTEGLEALHERIRACALT